LGISSPFFKVGNGSPEETAEFEVLLALPVEEVVVVAVSEDALELPVDEVVVVVVSEDELVDGVEVVEPVGATNVYAHSSPDSP
jgi:hypothetical protein